MDVYYLPIILIMAGCVFVLITVVCIKLVFMERRERIRKYSYSELEDI